MRGSIVRTKVLVAARGPADAHQGRDEACVKLSFVLDLGQGHTSGPLGETRADPRWKWAGVSDGFKRTPRPARGKHMPCAKKPRPRGLFICSSAVRMQGSPAPHTARWHGPPGLAHRDLHEGLLLESLLPWDNGRRVFDTPRRSCGIVTWICTVHQAFVHGPHLIHHASTTRRSMTVVHARSHPSKGAGSKHR